MKFLRALAILALAALIFFAAFNIVDTRCSLAVAALDEPTWEEMGQVDFAPGHYKVMKERR